MRLGLAAFALGVAAPALAAPPPVTNILVNGSFEAPPVVPSPGYLTAPGSPIFGWNGQNVDLVSNEFFGAGFAYDGQNVVDLVGEGSSGSLSQTFATVIGQVYSFTFRYSNNYASVNNGTVQAFISNSRERNPLLNTGLLSHTGASSGNALWSVYSGSFTATSTESILRFLGTGSNNGGIVIDDVVVSAAPEPGTWGMMIMGFGIAGAAMRRRRTAKPAVA
jgi:hypothetical protein